MNSARMVKRNAYMPGFRIRLATSPLGLPSPPMWAQINMSETLGTANSDHFRVENHQTMPFGVPMTMTSPYLTSRWLNYTYIQIYKTQTQAHTHTYIILHHYIYIYQHLIGAWCQNMD